MALPNKITPCPIEEAIIEIRFTPKMPHDAIFGVVYQSFKDRFTKVQNLPILQIPEPIRMQDPLLLYKAYYQLSNDNFALNIGPKVLSLSNAKEYIGWAAFSEEIKRCIKEISKLEVIEKVSRSGIRYINFFEGDVFKKINLEIKLGQEQLKSDSVLVRSTLKAGKFINNFRISNNVKLAQKGIPKEGSVIDIDTFLEGQIDIQGFDALIEEAHTEEKKLFFSLLREDFLKQLNPQY